MNRFSKSNIALGDLVLFTNNDLALFRSNPECLETYFQDCNNTKEKIDNYTTNLLLDREHSIKGIIKKETLEYPYWMEIYCSGMYSVEFQKDDNGIFIEIPFVAERFTKAFPCCSQKNKLYIPIYRESISISKKDFLNRKTEEFKDNYNLDINFID